MLASLLKIGVEAPYQLAMRSGAVVLEERPLGITILLLTEVPNISLELVNKFIVHAANQQYIKEVEAYLAGTANLTKPRVVEYTASATDSLGRLYGRGPCAQRLPRKVRLLLFGTTHQEVDMIGSFYENHETTPSQQPPPTHSRSSSNTYRSFRVGIAESAVCCRKATSANCNECRGQEKRVPK